LRASKPEDKKLEENIMNFVGKHNKDDVIPFEIPYNHNIYNNRWRNCRAEGDWNWKALGYRYDRIVAWRSGAKAI